jgi:hypothetical protein
MFFKPSLPANRLYVTSVWRLANLSKPRYQGNPDLWEILPKQSSAPNGLISSVIPEKIQASFPPQIRQTRKDRLHPEPPQRLTPPRIATTPKITDSIEAKEGLPCNARETHRDGSPHRLWEIDAHCRLYQSRLRGIRRESVQLFSFWPFSVCHGRRGRRPIAIKLRVQERKIDVLMPYHRGRF